MGFFDSIKNAVFGKPAIAQEVTINSHDPMPAPQSSIVEAADGVVIDGPVDAESHASPVIPANPTPQVSMPAHPVVDVARVLDDAVKASGQKLDWKSSIVDLMKALGIDSSLSARKELAKELNYTGDMSDSATMNIWLHKSVIKKLADNGGKLPADMID